MRLTPYFIDDAFRYDEASYVYKVITNGREIALNAGRPMMPSEFRAMAGTLAAPGREIREYLPLMETGDDGFQHTVLHLAAKYRYEYTSTPLTIAEKIAMLDEATPDDVERIKARITGGVVEVEGERVYVRKDLKAEIRAALVRDGVTHTAIAKHLGKSKQAFSNFINSDRPIVSNIEELLWLIEDGNAFPDEQTTIVSNHI